MVLLVLLASGGRVRGVENQLDDDTRIGGRRGLHRLRTIGDWRIRRDIHGGVVQIPKRIQTKLQSKQQAVVEATERESFEGRAAAQSHWQAVLHSSGRPPDEHARTDTLLLTRGHSSLVRFSVADSFAARPKVERQAHK